MINNLLPLFTFLLVFSSLNIIRNIFKIIGTLLQNDPKPLVLSNRDLIFLGLSISYIITFIIHI